MSPSPQIKDKYFLTYSLTFKKVKFNQVCEPQDVLCAAYFRWCFLSIDRPLWPMWGSSRVLCSWSGFREYYFWNLCSLQKVQELMWQNYWRKRWCIFLLGQQIQKAINKENRTLLLLMEWYKEKNKVHLKHGLQIMFLCFSRVNRKRKNRYTRCLWIPERTPLLYWQL